MLCYQGAATLATKVTARYWNTFFCLTEYRKNVTNRIFITPCARLFSLLSGTQRGRERVQLGARPTCSAARQPALPTGDTPPDKRHSH